MDRKTNEIIRDPVSGSYHEILPQQMESPIVFDYAKPHYSEHDSDRVHLLSWHEQLEVKYFLEGGAEITCGSNCFLTQTGDLLLINPYEYHKSRIFDPDRVPVYHLMGISLNHPSLRSVLRDNPELMGEGAPGTAELRMPFLKNVIRDPTAPCVTLFLLLAEEYKRSGDSYSPFKENLLRAFLYSLIRDAANHDTAETQRRQKKTVTILLPALRYIDAHLKERISVAVLARQCVLSTSRFSHLFKEVTGTGAVNYIQELRISKAAVLLATTGLSVAEVAEQVGFSDPAYFSRAFRKSCGMSPNEYRRFDGGRKEA